MKKIYILLLLCIFILTGCENKEEKVKSEYIAMKNNTLTQASYEEDLPVEIITTIKRIDEEAVSYKVIINNPSINMHNVKVLLAHNYYIEDVFPSIGIFDDVKELLVDSEEANELVLEGVIETTEDIRKLELELKVSIEYINDDGDKKDLYYTA